MKKTNLWSLMALCCCLFGALTLTTACGDDDDDKPTSGSTTGNQTLTGTWKSVHQGEQGAHRTEAITLNSDGTFEENITEADLDYWTKELLTSEELFKGTYTVTDGTYQVQLTDHKYKGAGEEDWRQIEVGNDETFLFTFEKYGNGYVAMNSLSGGVQFYTKDGEARQMPSLTGHELLGRWEYRSRETDPSALEMVEFYEFKADGTVEYGTYMYNYVDNFDAQGNKRTGVYVPVGQSIAQGFFGDSRDDAAIPSGVKLYSIVDDADYQLSQSEPGNFKTNFWEFYAVRFGGHPLQYVIKDGKLYTGIVGMDETYFYDRPYSKVK